MPAASTRDRSSAAARVEAALREAITSGALLPGEHIRQAVWAGQLDVSRLPVRQALNTLHADGTVQHDPNRGYFVTKRPTSEIAQLYLLRELVEPQVVASIAWPDERLLKQLGHSADLAVAALADGDIQTALHHDREFCWAIWDLSPLNIVVDEAKRLWLQCDPHRTTAFITPAFVEPLKIDYRARFDTYLRLLTAHDRDGLVAHIVAERRAMVDFLSPVT